MLDGVPHPAFWLKNLSMYLDLPVILLFLLLHNIVISARFLGSDLAWIIACQSTQATPSTPSYSTRATPPYSFSATPPYSFSATPPYSFSATPPYSFSATPSNSSSATPSYSLSATPSYSLSATPSNSTMSKRGRPNGSSHVDLSSEQVADFLSAHFVSSLGPTGVFPYSKGKASDAKKNTVWGDLKRIHLKGSVQPADSKTCKIK